MKDIRSYIKSNFLFVFPGRLNNLSFLEVIRNLYWFNFSRRTPLCEIMFREGSDKGLFAEQGRHNYTPIYHSLFKKYRKKSVCVFELGLGTTNSKFNSNMGPSGKPGASLRGWKKYFFSGEIFGADIDESVLFEENGIMTFYCDQTNPNLVNSMWRENKALNVSFDIIIEDGLHTFEANKIFLENSFYKVKANGFYVVEDVSRSEIGTWNEYLPKFSVNNGNVKYLILKIPNTFNSHDNNLIVIFK